MRRFVADLHVHSLLSPCAAVEMTPRNIIWHATRNGIDIVAIADHNSGANIRAAQEAARNMAVTVLPAMEVETKEEVHLLTLFNNLNELLAWEAIVKAHLPEKVNNADKFGGQFVVDAEDNLVAIEERLLLTSSSLGVKDVANKVAELGGLCIASHVDRPSYSIVSQLGFIPPDVNLAALELSSLLKRDAMLNKFPDLKKWPLIMSSDAHAIDRFINGPKTVFWLEYPNLAEIKKALAEGRISWLQA
ncbi:MAG: hypothetical protein H6Q74_421 [Firmicutes bacterium]|nr:hypothetical protein [Bacillota bacterium]